MKKVKVIERSTLTLKGIKCFLERQVKPFGTSARIDFPKEFIGKKVYVIVTDEYNWNEYDKKMIREEALKSLIAELKEPHFSNVQFPEEEISRFLDEVLKEILK